MPTLPSAHPQQFAAENDKSMVDTVKAVEADKWAVKTPPTAALLNGPDESFDPPEEARPRSASAVNNVNDETEENLEDSMDSGGATNVDTDGFKNDMGSGSSNILVAVRMRPSTLREKALGSDVIKILDGKLVVLLDPNEGSDDVLRANRSKEKQYAFDYAFGPEMSSYDVFESTTKFLIGGVLDGYNATVFAYGATGAGKTHTMIGSPSKPGLMVITLEDMFTRIRGQDDLVYKVHVSFLEVYNEMIRDLLSPGPELDLREDPVKGMCVAGVTEHHAQSADDIMDLLRKGNKNRSTEPTNANQVSSRSHAVLQVIVEQKARGDDTLKVGKLSLIDLAGSERAQKSDNRGLRLIEGANINRSLLALGNCINALGEVRRGTVFVPYRDSKLTRLLKDSLGGNCRTVMISCISPSSLSFEETHNTLKYANRAKNIKTKVQRNVLNVNYHISQYTNLIAELRGEVSRLKSELASVSEGGIPRQMITDRHEEEQKHVVKKLRDDIMRYFGDRQQITQTLVDLRSVVNKNKLVIADKERIINKWESEHPDTAAMDEPQEVWMAREDLKKVNMQQDKNKVAIMDLEKRVELGQMALTNKMKQELESKVAKERREYVESIYRYQLSVCENLQFAEEQKAKQKELASQESEIERLKNQLKLRDQIIEKQNQRLQANQLEHEDLDVLADDEREIARRPSKKDLFATRLQSSSPLPDYDMSALSETNESTYDSAMRVLSSTATPPPPRMRPVDIYKRARAEIGNTSDGEDRLSPRRLSQLRQSKRPGGRPGGGPSNMPNGRRLSSISSSRQPIERRGSSRASNNTHSTVSAPRKSFLAIVNEKQKTRARDGRAISSNVNAGGRTGGGRRPSVVTNHRKPSGPPPPKFGGGPGRRQPPPQSYQNRQRHYSKTGPGAGFQAAARGRTRMRSGSRYAGGTGGRGSDADSEDNNPQKDGLGRNGSSSAAQKKASGRARLRQLKEPPGARRKAPPHSVGDSDDDSVVKISGVKMEIADGGGDDSVDFFASVDSSPAPSTPGALSNSQSHQSQQSSHPQTPQAKREIRNAVLENRLSLLKKARSKAPPSNSSSNNTSQQSSMSKLLSHHQLPVLAGGK